MRATRATKVPLPVALHAIIALTCGCGEQKSPPSHGLDASGVISADGASSVLDASSDSSAVRTSDSSSAIPDAATGGFVTSPGCTQPAAKPNCADGLCTIPAGCFAMGAPRDEPFASAMSNIQVEVRLTRSFLIGRTEVTRAQWQTTGFPVPTPDWTRTGSSDSNTPPEGYSQCDEPDCPVTWVTFEDAASYANTLSANAGLKPCYLLDACAGAPGLGLRCASIKVDAADAYSCEGFRLPIEAEWEYAARAGTATAFYSGDIAADLSVSYDCELDPNLDAIAWYCANSGSPRAKAWHAHHVAQKQPNAWGLFDTSGNVAEWVNDLYNPFGYGIGPLVDPFSLDAPRDDLAPKEHPVYGTGYLDVDGFSGYRGVRGGSFDLWAYSAKSNSRFYGGVAGQLSGFRIARTLP